MTLIGFYKLVDGEYIVVNPVDIPVLAEVQKVYMVFEDNGAFIGLRIGKPEILNVKYVKLSRLVNKDV